MTDSSNGQANQPETDQQKTCFVIAPIGGSGTNIRRATNGLVDTVIRPVLDEFDYKVEIAHRISETGSITNQIINLLVDAELVVAVLTEKNPNVMYELGVRHSARKPVISLALEGTKLPFDVGQERTIFYTDDMQGVEDARQSLKQHVEGLDDEQVDNPVYRAIEFNVMEKKARESGDDAMAYLISQVESLSSQVEKLDITNNLRKNNPSRQFSKPHVHTVWVDAKGRELKDIANKIDELDGVSVVGVYGDKTRCRIDAVTLDPNMPLENLIEIIKNNTHFSVFKSSIDIPPF